MAEQQVLSTAGGGSCCCPCEQQPAGHHWQSQLAHNWCWSCAAIRDACVVAVVIICCCCCRQLCVLLLTPPAVLLQVSAAGALQPAGQPGPAGPPGGAVLPALPCQHTAPQQQEQHSAAATGQDPAAVATTTAPRSGPAASPVVSSGACRRACLSHAPCLLERSVTTGGAGGKQLPGTTLADVLPALVMPVCCCVPWVCPACAQLHRCAPACLPACLLWCSIQPLGAFTAWRPHQQQPRRQHAQQQQRQSVRHQAISLQDRHTSVSSSWQQQQPPAPRGTHCWNKQQQQWPEQHCGRAAQVDR